MYTFYKTKYHPSNSLYIQLSVNRTEIKDHQQQIPTLPLRPGTSGTL